MILALVSLPCVSSSTGPSEKQRLSKLRKRLGIRQKRKPRKMQFGSGGSVSAGPTTIQTTGTPPWRLKPLYVPVRIPVRKAKPKDNQPLFIVPQIVLPDRKRRVFVHHHYPRNSYAVNSAQRMNPMFLSSLINNPYYKSWTVNDPMINEYMQDPQWKSEVSKWNRQIKYQKGRMIV